MKTVSLLALLFCISCSDNLYKAGKCYTARKENDGRMLRVIAVDKVSAYTLFSDGIEPDSSFVVWLKYYSDQARIVPCTEKTIPREDAKQKVKDICARSKKEKLVHDKVFCQKYGE